MIDAAKADIALQLTIQIKNKVLEAYQEIMRMPL
jgi:flagellar hook-basal body complex protein FliE